MYAKYAKCINLVVFFISIMTRYVHTLSYSNTTQCPKISGAFTDKLV